MVTVVGDVPLLQLETLQCDGAITRGQRGALGPNVSKGFFGPDVLYYDDLSDFEEGHRVVDDRAPSSVSYIGSEVRGDGISGAAGRAPCRWNLVIGSQLCERNCCGHELHV